MSEMKMHVTMADEFRGTVATGLFHGVVMKREIGGPKRAAKQHLGLDLDPQQGNVSQQKAAAAAAAAAAEGWIGSVTLPKVSNLYSSLVTCMLT